MTQLLVFLFFFTLPFLLASILFVSFKALGCGHKAVLKIVERLRRDSIWLFFFAALLRIVGHRWVLLFLVSVYTFVFFNPSAAVSNAKEQDTTYCPNGYAYRIAIGRYIACEDFNEFYENAAKGIVRTDLIKD